MQDPLTKMHELRGDMLMILAVSAYVMAMLIWAGTEVAPRALWIINAAEASFSTVAMYALYKRMRAYLAYRRYWMIERRHKMWSGK